MAKFATRCRPAGLIPTLELALILLMPLSARAQVGPYEAACSYLDGVFSTCWTRRGVTPYTASAVADCVCNVGGQPDPLIDSAVPSCTTYLETASLLPEPAITSWYSSFRDYCSSYAPAQNNQDPQTTATDDNPDIDGFEDCQLILGSYYLCQQSPEDLITQPEVASCLCHDPNGEFNTAFDDLLTPCYDWAKTWETAFASEVSSIFDFCTEYGTVGVTDNPSPTITSLSNNPTTTPRDRPTLTFSQIDDPASSACEKVALIANACRTASLDPLTRVGVANCICQDPDDPNGGFGTKFDEYLTRCYPYAKTRSPAAASEILSLSGYCTRFADGGKTYAVTSTTEEATATVTDDIFETSSGATAETGLPNAESRNEVPVVVVAVIAIAVVMLH
ncbi:hypothetical protein ABW19_dt0202244 [Dactylella cylindrospora]|nr:hypothetical protein ABW19_dt0202244 [Dactylella cylindrospora]